MFTFKRYAGSSEVARDLKGTLDTERQHPASRGGKAVDNVVRKRAQRNRGELSPYLLAYPTADGHYLIGPS